jgi:hypothetical protein
MIVKFYQADVDAKEEMMRKATSMLFSDEVGFNAIKACFHISFIISIHCPR